MATERAYKGKMGGIKDQVVESINYEAIELRNEE